MDDTLPMPLTELPPARSSSRALRSSAADAYSYLLSSVDLRSGLQAELIAITELPAEVLSELLRLRRCWPGAAPITRH